MRSEFTTTVFTILVVLLGTVLTGCFGQEPEPTEPGLRLAADHEFIQSGLLQLQELYDLEFSEVHGMVIGLTHEALRARDVDVAKGFTTDAKLVQLDLVCLEDDKGFFPANNPALVVRQEVVEEYPEIPELLEAISHRLDTPTMIHLNYQVDIEESEPEAVAKNWLREEGLLGEAASDPGAREPVVVSSKEFVEQEILGQLVIMALRSAGIPVEDRTDLGGTQANRTALLRGQVDLYWEYLGKAWHDVHHQEEVISDPDEVFAQLVERDREQGLVWLAYAPVNSTLSLMMCRQEADELGIRTISDLAEYARTLK